MFNLPNVVLQASPFILFLELPFTLAVLLGTLRWWIRKLSLPPRHSLYRPRVSCVITCYSEGRDVQRTLLSLCEQTYPGEIELIPVIDGATSNTQTMEAVRSFQCDPKIYPKRRVRPIAKWQRGGRVSSLNAGLSMSSGEIVMALDGDTSFDNDMVSAVVRHFEDPNVPAVSGNLRVRNRWQSLVTAMQAIEYLISISQARIGLGEWNVVNNISGAFGVFRRSVLEQIGGWDTHSAEDLDLTLRLKSYFRRHPQMRIPFEPRAIGHTDVPSTFKDLLVQRLRWDGDLLFLYGRKHRGNINPSLMGWPNFAMTLFGGLFVQIVLPFIILSYSLMLAITEPWPRLMALSGSIYAAYLLILTIQFLAVLILSSEKPKQDMLLLPLLPLFPITMFAIRCWSAIAMLNELLRRGHEETAMAPWWVISRANRF
jgi:cellulose synthase/poly-beta-1,6-N-acetylglucosamine synthase-like glycosyltransferase